MMQRQVIENELVPIYGHDEFERAVDARELHQFLQVGRDFSNWIKQRLAETGAVEGADYRSPNLANAPDAGFRVRIDYWLTLDLAKEIAMLERSAIGTQVRRYFIEVEKRYRQGQLRQAPASHAEVALLMAQQLVEQERRIAQLQEQQTVLAHRIESLDSVNIEGELDQRLNAMIRLYARKAGIGYDTAWKQFDRAYDLAFRCNLQSRRDHASIRAGRKLSRPEYLKLAGTLEDAVRIADKLLNSVAS